MIKKEAILRMRLENISSSRKRREVQLLGHEDSYYVNYEVVRGGRKVINPNMKREKMNIREIADESPRILHTINIQTQSN